MLRSLALGQPKRDGHDVTPGHAGASRDGQLPKSVATRALGADKQRHSVDRRGNAPFPHRPSRPSGASPSQQPDRSKSERGAPHPPGATETCVCCPAAKEGGTGPVPQAGQGQPTHLHLRCPRPGRRGPGQARRGPRFIAASAGGATAGVTLVMGPCPAVVGGGQQLLCSGHLGRRPGGPVPSGRASEPTHRCHLDRRAGRTTTTSPTSPSGRRPTSLAPMTGASASVGPLMPLTGPVGQQLWGGFKSLGFSLLVGSGHQLPRLGEVPCPDGGDAPGSRANGSSCS